MQLVFRLKGVRGSRDLKPFIQRKLATGLGRFSRRVRDLRVDLVDVNGPKGGEDIHCRIVAKMASGGVLTISERCSDPFAAVARASARVRHRLRRELCRLKDRRRGR